MQIIQRNAVKLFLIGLGIVTTYNWRLWQRDRALADRLREERTPAPQLVHQPKVSALVAAWNEAAHIDAHIQSFLAMRYPNIELVICAGGADGTLARALRYQSERVVVLEQRPGEGKQKALARCFEHASGEIIYLTDADCLFDQDALVRLLEPIVNEGEQATTGGSRPLDDQERALLPGYLWAIDEAVGARAGASSDGLLGRNAGLTRQAIERIGGLDFVARTGTDYQLAQRLLHLGIKIRYVAESIVQSEYPETIAEYRRRQSRWLRNLLIHGRRYGARADVLVTAKTIATGMGMLVAPLAAVWLGIVALLPWSLLVAHAAASKLRYLLFATRLRDRAVPMRLLGALLPLTLLDFVIRAAPILDLILPERRERW